jgi:hypothetical protein
MDLSVKQQFVDLVLIRQGPGPLPQPLPDGCDNLAGQNVLTFKSHQEALDGWALCELVGHYVNHRKQCSPSLKDLLPETDFRLYAVCVRYPNNLAREVPLTPLQAGVYEVPLLTQRIRVIVVQQLPQAEQNALLHLFSTRVEQVRYGSEHYRPRTHELTTLFYDLFKRYSEDPDMSKELQEYARERIKELLKDVPPEERLEGLLAEERLKGLSPEERLKGLSPEELEAMEVLIRQRKANGPSTKPQ